MVTIKVKRIAQCVRIKQDQIEYDIKVKYKTYVLRWIFLCKIYPRLQSLFPIKSLLQGATSNYVWYQGRDVQERTGWYKSCFVQVILHTAWQNSFVWSGNVQLFITVDFGVEWNWSHSAGFIIMKNHQMKKLLEWNSTTYFLTSQERKWVGHFSFYLF